MRMTHFESQRKLTSAQLRIMRLFCLGLNSKDAARILGVSFKTAETHRANIYRKIALYFREKYGIRQNELKMNLAIAVVWTIHQGFFKLPDEEEYVKALQSARGLRLPGYIPSTRSGYVYLFYSKVRKLYKIGFTVNPEKRLRALQTGTGDRSLESVIFGPGNTLLEKLLLEKYASKCTEGEWFQLSNRDVKNLIERFRDGL